MTFNGNKVLVTGGGSGIGLHLASRLHRDGALVIICGRRSKEIDNACAEHPGMRGLACDLSRDSEILKVENFVRAAFGGLDLLFNNAAVQTQDDLTDPASDFSAIENEIRTNLVAPIRMTHRFLPLMAGRPGATMVNIVSLLGVMAKPSAPVYCATKAGLMQFTRAMELVLADAGVRMVTAMPPPCCHGHDPRPRRKQAESRELRRRAASSTFGGEAGHPYRTGTHADAPTPVPSGARRRDQSQAFSRQDTSRGRPLGFHEGAG